MFIEKRSKNTNHQPIICNNQDEIKFKLPDEKEIPVLFADEVEANKVRIKHFDALLTQYKKLLYKERKNMPIMNKMYEEYLRGSEKRNKDFTISVQEFENIKSLPCTYCGKIPSPYNGIDRIDNKLGYVPGNCQPCCTPCNKMKNSLSHEEFIDRIKLIYEKYKT